MLKYYRAAGVHAARSLRQSAIFLNLHFLNKPELSFSIRDPGTFDAATGDLISEQGISRVTDLVQSLVAWTHRLQQ